MRLRGGSHPTYRLQSYQKYYSTSVYFPWLRSCANMVDLVTEFLENSGRLNCEIYALAVPDYTWLEKV